MKSKIKKGRIEPSPSKSIRFSDVVAASGEPIPAILWTRPEEDPGFSRGIRENRVMTVKEDRVGSKRDFGLVGFWPGEGASYLLFPKPLDRFADLKVVGIKYELTRSAGPVGRLVDMAADTKGLRRNRGRSTTERPQTRSERLRQPSLASFPPEGSKPAVRRFKVTLRFTGVAESTREVEASSAKEARVRALEGVEMPNAFRVVKRRVTRVESVG